MFKSVRDTRGYTAATELVETGSFSASDAKLCCYSAQRERWAPEAFLAASDSTHGTSISESSFLIRNGNGFKFAPKETDNQPDQEIKENYYHQGGGIVDDADSLSKLAHDPKR